VSFPAASSIRPSKGEALVLPSFLDEPPPHGVWVGSEAFPSVGCPPARLDRVFRRCNGLPGGRAERGSGQRFRRLRARWRHRRRCPSGFRSRVARARALWKAGARANPGLLDASRLPDLEASFRRAQRRFAEALALLEKALSAQNPARAAHILLNKAVVCEQMVDCEGAIAALERAAPFLDAESAPRPIWVHASTSRSISATSAATSRVSARERLARELRWVGFLYGRIS
jgi:hypothetical protein